MLHKGLKWKICSRHFVVSYYHRLPDCLWVCACIAGSLSRNDSLTLISMISICFPPFLSVNLPVIRKISSLLSLLSRPWEGQNVDFDPVSLRFSLPLVQLHIYSVASVLRIGFGTTLSPHVSITGGVLFCFDSQARRLSSEWIAIRASGSRDMSYLCINLACVIDFHGNSTS